MNAHAGQDSSRSSTSALSLTKRTAFPTARLERPSCHSHHPIRVVTAERADRPGHPSRSLERQASAEPLLIRRRWSRAQIIAGQRIKRLCNFQEAQHERGQVTRRATLIELPAKPLTQSIQQGQAPERGGFSHSYRRAWSLSRRHPELRWHPPVKTPTRTDPLVRSSAVCPPSPQVTPSTSSWLRRRRGRKSAASA